MSIWIAVPPFAVPATLKSMSPRWSSSPKMSDRTAIRSPSLMRPMAMPETFPFVGIPASISDREAPHTVAIGEEPVAPVLARGGAGRGGDEHLGLAAGEDGRPVGAREHPDPAVDGPDVRKSAPVDPPFFGEDLPADDLLLQILEGGRDERRLFQALLLGEGVADRLGDLLDPLAPVLLGPDPVPSPIRSASRLPATKMLMSLRAKSGIRGLMTSSPSILPTRAPAMGPSKGISERGGAAGAAIMASTAGALSLW